MYNIYYNINIEINIKLLLNIRALILMCNIKKLTRTRLSLFQLSEDIGYVLYSALGSFYIPSCIMVFVYIRIYFAAKARARRGIRKQPRPRAAVPPESPDVRQTSFTQSTPATDAKKRPGLVMENVATIENQPVQIPIVTCDFASDVSTSEADPGGGISIPMEEKDTLKVRFLTVLNSTFCKDRLKA